MPATLAGSVMRQLATALAVSAALATVFTAWTPASLDPAEMVGRLLGSIEARPAGEEAQASATEETSLRVGVVAGHWGLNPSTGMPDPGSTCPDGLTELQVNQEIAGLVVRGLEAAGLQPDLLEEFDPRLTGYRAVALVSIHTDACVAINEQATGYKVAAAVDTAVPDRAQRLVACLADRYGRATGLRYHSGSITRDMTEYHTFYEVHSLTPAAIVEVGFLYLDRSFLTQEPERAARGIVDGILCYVNNEPATLPGDGQP